MKRLAVIGIVVVTSVFMTVRVYGFGSYVPYHGPLYDGVWLKTGGIRNNEAYSFLIFSKVSNNFFMLIYYSKFDRDQNFIFVHRRSQDILVN